MNDRTLHKLIDTADEYDLQCRVDCQSLDHLPLTFNVHLGQTFCHCGHARYSGDRHPMHPVRCYSEGCNSSCPRARAEHRRMLPPTLGAEAAPKRFERWLWSPEQLDLFGDAS